MLAITVRKMRKNIWMTLCLFLGCLLSVALVSSLSVYSRAIIQRMIVRGYEQREAEKNIHPMTYSVQYRYVFSSGELTDDLFNYLDAEAMELFSEIDLPALTARKSFRFNDIYLHHLALTQAEKGRVASWFTLSAPYEINEHIDIVHGRRPQPKANEYEVLASREAVHALGLSLDSRYEVASIKDLRGDSIILRLVGIFEPKDKADLYWFENTANTVFLDPDVYDSSLYISLVGSQEGVVSTSYSTFSWDFALDYRMLAPDMVDALTDTVIRQAETIRASLRASMSNMDVLESFNVKRQQISIFLPTLLVPIIALLAFFITMISGLVYDYDKNERTLMQSRGAGKSKIVAMYVYQSFIIAALALCAGIPLSVFFCKLIGSSNGFLEFVGRTPLEVAVSMESIVYSLFGAVVFLLAMLLPIVFSREDSIVINKRNRSRSTRTFFEKYYIDLLLLALSIAGFYTYENIADIMTQAGVSAKDMPMNPLLFIISSMFIFGCCLLFTRLYPYLIEFLFRAGQKSWPPVIYSSLINTSRIRSRGRFLMIFLVATVSMGIFSSAAARTINQNYEDRIEYNIGADIRLKEKWKSFDPDPQYTPDGQPVKKHEKDLIYPGEPSFEKYLELEGVRSATKVYANDRAYINRNGSISGGINVMCVIPREFSDIAWNRSDLHPYHINHMMNAMSANPYAVLVSESLMEKYSLLPGDSIVLGWENNNESLNCVIYDSFRFFPSYDPTVLDENGEPKHLIIMNYELIAWVFRLEPYEVWISKEAGYPAADIYQQMVDADIPLDSFLNASSDVVDMKNDPLIQGMNGNLTLSFVVTIIITVTGFMIYWVFNLKSRQLQMGIIRSMGMSTPGVIAILLFEQFFMSFLPMLAGFGIGGLSSNTFVPMFEFGVTASKTAPPYRVFIILSDYLRIGVVIIVVILLAMIVLGVMISRLKMSQTLKLGED